MKSRRTTYVFQNNTLHTTLIRTRCLISKRETSIIGIEDGDVGNSSLVDVGNCVAGGCAGGVVSGLGGCGVVDCGESGDEGGEEGGGG